MDKGRQRYRGALEILESMYLPGSAPGIIYKALHPETQEAGE